MFYKKKRSIISYNLIYIVKYLEPAKCNSNLK